MGLASIPHCTARCQALVEARHFKHCPPFTQLAESPDVLLQTVRWAIWPILRNPGLLQFAVGLALHLRGIGTRVIIRRDYARRVQ